MNELAKDSFASNDYFAIVALPAEKDAFIYTYTIPWLSKLLEATKVGDTKKTSRV